jgi:hypothetical protein
MLRFALYVLIVFGSLTLIADSTQAQDERSPKIVSAPISSTSPALPPRENPATVEQIAEYLRLSGDMDTFRTSWIAAVDKNRSLGAPYWPESFWTALKAEMEKTDLVPMYVTFFQHGISKELMQEVLNTYHTMGKDHFRGSPACFKLGDALLAMTADFDSLKLAKTEEVSVKIYDIYKPEIKAARARYQAEHPDWKDN